MNEMFKDVPVQQMLTPDFEAIEASGLPDIASRWCVWRAEAKANPEEGFKKVPSNGKTGIDGGKLEQWLTYSEAKQIYLAGKYDGVGLMPLDIDGLVGLDADKVLYDTGVCRGSGAYGIVHEMERIGCYMERSPSGAGVRGFVMGIKAEGCKSSVKKNGHSVECYQRTPERNDNYLTVTGRIWEGDDGDREVKQVSVEGGQEALDEFLAAFGLLGSSAAEAGALVAKVSAKGGYGGEWTRRTDEAVKTLMLSRLNPQGLYSRLMDGDIVTDFGGGVSEARFALLSQLAYITRDDEQIERIARTSKLDASRFDEKRSGFRNRLHWDVMNALKLKERNYDDDQAQKRQGDEQKGVSAKALKAKAGVLHGGLDGLTGPTGKLIAGSQTLAELLVRDKSLLGVMFYDEFAGMPMKAISFADAFGDKCAPSTAGQLEDDDFLAVTAWARNKWCFVAEERSVVSAGVRRWARANSINPVTDKLQKFADEWDGVERLGSWLVKYLGADGGYIHEPHDDDDDDDTSIQRTDADEDKAYYLAEVGKRFLVGVVARVFVPGTQQDQMLVLEAAVGGEGKTAAVRIMGKAIDESAFLEGFSPSDNKDCFMLMRGKVLGEWGELAGFDKKESSWNKQFVTRAEDTYRDPYGALHKSWKRTISFVATSNSDDYLKETGGMRRYWPVKVGFVDLVGLDCDMPQLWGEAVRLYQSSFQFWVDKTAPRDARFRRLCDREQRGRLVVTAYDDLAKELAENIVAGRVEVQTKLGEVRATSSMVFSVKQMGQMLFRNDYEPERTDWRKEWQNMVVPALKRCGWTNAKKLSGNNPGWSLTQEAINEALERNR